MRWHMFSCRNSVDGEVDRALKTGLFENVLQYLGSHLASGGGGG